MPSKLLQKRETEVAKAKMRTKRSRILVAVGALILLSTFVVKEVLRDQLKDSSDKIGTALLDLQRQEGVNTPDAQLLFLNKRLTQLTATFENVKEGETITQIQLTDLLTDLSQMYVDAVDMVSYVSAVQDAFPRQIEILNRRRAKVKSDLEHLRGEVKRRGDDARKEPKPNWKGHGSAVVGCIQVTLFELQATFDWQTPVVAHAEKVKRAEEYLYRTCTWLSYFLYLLGWAVTVIGGWYGLTTESSG